MKSLSFLSGIGTGLSIAFYPTHPFLYGFVIASGIFYLLGALASELL